MVNSVLNSCLKQTSWSLLYTREPQFKFLLKQRKEQELNRVNDRCSEKDKPGNIIRHECNECCILNKHGLVCWAKLSGLFKSRLEQQKWALIRTRNDSAIFGAADSCVFFGFFVIAVAFNSPLSLAGFLDHFPLACLQPV